MDIETQEKRNKHEVRIIHFLSHFAINDTKSIENTLTLIQTIIQYTSFANNHCPSSDLPQDGSA